MHEIEGWWYPVLFATGIGAGFVDSVAGGGGLITLPVLMQTGLPPQVVLATNKLQATFGSASACWHFFKAGMIDGKHAVRTALYTFLGAAAGTLMVSKLDADLLRRSIPWLLGTTAVYTLFQPRLGQAEAKARMGNGVFAVVCGLGLGFYDGFFGPGTGSFWALSHVLLLGHDLRRATAHAKLMNFMSNITSLLVFLWAGQVLFAAGLCMGAGQWLGARMGSKMVIRHGAAWVRPVLITVTLALTARLIWLNHRGPH